jgi:hypothetical protein
MASAHKHLAALFALSAALVSPAAEAQITMTSLADVATRVGGIPLAELIASTAGDIRGKTVAKYGGDFAAYWQAARSSLEGKAFEAVVAHASNSRFRATSQGTRVVPTALLCQPGNQTGSGI